MASDVELLEGLDEYRWDFRDPATHVFKTRKGLDEEIVRQISEKKEEPEWMLEFRLKALKHFEERPMPTWGGDISDLNLDENEIMVKDTKNYDDRKVILSEKCVRVLQEYLGTVWDYEGDAVFISRKRQRISRNRVYALVREYGRLAGIQKTVTPHVLRHTFATTMIGNGASVIEVKQQLGHRSLESTLRYVHLQTEERKKLYMAHCPKF